MEWHGKANKYRSKVQELPTLLNVNTIPLGSLPVGTGPFKDVLHRCIAQMCCQKTMFCVHIIAYKLIKDTRYTRKGSVYFWCNLTQK